MKLNPTANPPGRRYWTWKLIRRARVIARTLRKPWLHSGPIGAGTRRRVVPQFPDGVFFKGGSLVRKLLTLLAVLALAVCWVAPAAADIFYFSTGEPDGLIAVASHPAGTYTDENEAADDFTLDSETLIIGASFYGLLPYDSSPADINDVIVEIYRVFPNDSDLNRQIQVPTRVNSPGDVELDDRSFSEGGLFYVVTVLAPQYQAANSVTNGIFPAPNQTTGGEGPVAGQLVRIDVLFEEPFDLPAAQYFFVPQVGLRTSSGVFHWLSAPFLGEAGDLQMWTRNGNIQPDWLRVATDIVGGDPKFNGAFSLWGETIE
jgi:hypothetical protein